MSRTLIRGGCVLTMAKANFAEADVLVEDGTIVEVGPGLRARDAEVVDASNTIVIPGFVDCHRHAWESLFRNLGDYPTPDSFAAHFGPDDVYAATLVGLLGAVEAGVTTVVDWFGPATGIAHVDAALQAHTDAGLRTVFALAPPPWEEEAGWAEGLRRLAAAGTGPRCTVAAGSGAPTRTDVGRVVGQWAVARELGLRVHAHAGADRADGGTVAELGARHALGADVTLVHGTHLDGADLDAVASSGTQLALAPSEEMTGGFGSPPVQALIDREIKPGLGVGTEHLAPGDLFAQMRAVISIQHASYFDLKLAGRAGLPNLLNTRETLRYATVHGARVAGLGGTVGALEPGKRADVVVLRADRPNIHPINDPIGAVVWGMDTSNVDWVFVEGEALVRGGVLTADVARARSLAEEARRRVMAAAGASTGAEAAP
jgi:5-methylthioadenosine/S-adenosylhomocysteine deaminase